MTYFPELRNFVMENASYFNTAQTLFFSRRIVAPEFGMRLRARWDGGL